MYVNVLDPAFPALASSAAVELDLLINGEPTDLEAVNHLGEHLKKSLGNPTSDKPACSLHVNTETETILGQAFLQVFGKTQVNPANPETILKELVHRTEDIAYKLSSIDLKTMDKDGLELPRAFCLALSQLAAAYRQYIFEVRPPHPFRR